MKRLYFYLSTLFCIFALGLSTVACSEDDEFGAYEGLSVKVYSPTKVIPGQEVVISGTGLDLVTSVVFPGEVATSSIEVVNAGMIKVITPAGIDANGGELTVKTESDQVTARVPMTIGNPKISIMNPSDKANVNDELTITGTDMEFFSKAYFPGEDGNDVVVNAIDFNRKSTSQLRLSVPRGIAEGMAAIRLETCDGKQYTLPEIELSATVPGYWETQEIILWEGEEDLGTWSNNWSVKAAWFAGVEVGTEITFHFEVYNDWAQFKTNTGEWGPITIPEWGNQTVTTGDLLADATSLSFVLTEELMNPWFTTGDSWGNGDAIIINGEGVKFTKISYTKEVFIEGDAGGPVTLVGWEGKQEVSWSDDAGKIPVPYEIFADLPVGATLNIEYDQIDQTWGCLQLNDGSWKTIPFEELNGATQFEPTSDSFYGWTFDSRCTQFKLTQSILDQIHAAHGDAFGVDAGMVIQGSSIILTKVSVTYETGGGGAAETVIWEGEEDLGSWSLNYEVKPNTAFVDAGVTAGMSMSIYAEAYAEGAKIQLFNGHWERLFGDVELLIPEDGVVTVPIDETLAGYLTEYIDWGYCLIVQGQDCILKKITIF
ncbi:MAG: IPT/TIG domain-containing protein [Bacteroides sp.]|nr:IPT/TIG domain-containing protein [Bacteroides sp.]